MQMPTSPTQVQATVPAGAKEGDTFQVLINRAVVSVSVPLGAKPGMPIRFPMPKVQAQHEGQGSPSPQMVSPSTQAWSPSSAPNSPYDRTVLSPQQKAGTVFSPQQKVGTVVSPQQRASVGNMMSASKSLASKEQTIQFPGGRMGLAIDDDGTVNTVDDGPGKTSGVQVGWRIVKICGKPFTTDVLSDATAGDEQYNITFDTSKELRDDNKETAGNVEPARNSLVSLLLPVGNKDKVGNVKPAPNCLASKEQTIKFPAGRIGLDIDGYGTVDAVDDGPGKASGVQAGWRIVKIGGKAFTTDLLGEATAGSKHYDITFETSQYISPMAVGA